MRYLIALLVLCSCSTTAHSAISEPPTPPTTTRTQAVATTQPPQTPSPVLSLPKELGLDAIAELNTLRRAYPCDQWLETALSVGWPVDLWPQLSFVLYRESRCRPDVRSATSDTGLAQVNDYWCEPSKYSEAGWLQDQGLLLHCSDLTNPTINLKSALAIFQYSADRNANGWNPWRMTADFEPPVVAD
jgi:hypothetical protein